MGFYPNNKMKEFKNIDRLFQEKFRDFEQIPPENVWENISASLSGQTKNKNRALWLWFSGIAAGLALLFLLNHSMSQTDNLNHSTTDTQDTSLINTEIPNSEVSHTDEKDVLIDKTKTDIITNNKNQNTYRNNTTLSHSRLMPHKQDLPILNIKNTIANTPKTTKSKQNKSLPLLLNKENSKGDLASNEFIKTDKSTLINTQRNNKIDLKELNKKAKIKQTQIKNRTRSNREHEALASHTSARDKNKASSKETQLHKVRDDDKYSMAVITKKWTVSTTVAPVFFNTFDNNTSSFGKRFDHNTKQGQFSTAYGVQLAYQVNTRLSVQTGLHKVDYGYKTNEVYVPSNYFADNNRLTVGINDVINVRDFNAPPNELGVIKEISSGSLMQVFGYYEIPIEFKYQLVKGQLGIDVVSGFSTLIRTKDEVYYQLEDFSQKIDETSNLNAVNLTGNIGIEANYKIGKNIAFSVTPMFKVHTNTFTKEAGKSNPYALGVYSGLNYRF